MSQLQTGPGSSVEPANQSHPVLSENQLRAAQLLATLPFTMTITAKAKKLGVRRETLHRWRKDPAFMEAVIARSRELYREHIPTAHQAVIKKLEDGDPRILEMYFKMVGEIKDSKRRDAMGVWLETLGDCASDACITILETHTRRVSVSRPAPAPQALEDAEVIPAPPAPEHLKRDSSSTPPPLPPETGECVLGESPVGVTDDGLGI